ncbi:MAG: hypothetical protein ACRC8Q_08200, partial [Aeromonas sp.]
ELSGTIMKVAAVTSVIVIAIGGLSLAVAAILGPMAVMKLTFSVLGIQGGMLGGALRMLGAPFGMLFTVVKVLTGAFIRMGIAMLSNPLTWIIALVAGLAYGVYLLYQNWDGVSAWFNALWEQCKGPLLAFWEVIKGVFAWTPLGLVIMNWGAISVWFASLWEQCKGPLLAFWEVLKGVFAWTPLGMIVTNWGEIWAYFDSLPAGMAAKGQAIIDGLLTGISSKWEALKGKLASITSLMPSWLGGGGANVTIKQAAASPALAPKKAAASAAPGFAGMFDNGGIIPRGKWGIAGENGPEVIEGPARVTSRRATAAMASAAMLATMPLAAMPTQQLDTARTIREQIAPSGAGIRPAARIVDTPRPLPSGSSGTTHINAPITIHQQPGQSGADVAQEVRRELDRRERQAAAASRASLSDRN